MSDKKNRRDYDALLEEFSLAMTALRVAERELDEAERVLKNAHEKHHWAECEISEAHACKQKIEEKLRAYALIFGYKLPDVLTSAISEEGIPF